MLSGSEFQGKIMVSYQWHQLPVSEVTQQVGSDLSQGLTSATVEQRQQAEGLNELPTQKGKSALLRFLQEFNQPLIYILLIAGLMTFLLKDWVDAGVILGVTLINAVIGFIQESKAEKAISALAQSLSTEATVIRDGQKIRLNSRELVRGDLVLLQSGDRVPADLRLVQVRDLQVSEAALTGESLPVAKTEAALPGDNVLADRLNMAYGGSLVTFGRGRGLVVAIAEQTETGRISQLLKTTVDLETPLTRKIQQLSKKLLYIILGFATLTFVLSLGQGQTWPEAFKASVALGVSAIPEGLPAVVTVTLAIGVEKMAQRHAIIRKLPAVETLGSTTVICSDKTGTLTENQMTVQVVYAGEQLYEVTGVGYEGEGKILSQHQPLEIEAHPTLRACLTCGLLCNDASLQKEAGQWEVTGDPTEGALIVAAGKVGLTSSRLETDYPRLDTLPFESQYQYMATLHAESDNADRQRVYVKGSMEAILLRCDRQLNAQGQLVPLNPQPIEQVTQQMAAQGLRVLGFAQGELTKTVEKIDHAHIAKNLIFLGLQGMIDPPRQEAIAAVQACQRAGIQVKMITGDHALTAMAIAEQLGLNAGTSALTGEELSCLSPQALAAIVTEKSVFARVTPEQKLRLVEALQYNGEIVAMTGDGVNDAPALKQADIGVAMGITGTEVAKEAADMILTDDNFAAIAAAVEEGRTVYDNLLKTISFILPVNGGEGLTILVGIAITVNLPILPVQILWVNMVSSVALSATLAFEPKSPRTMERPPNPPQQPLLSPKLLWRIGIISLFNVLVVLGMFEFILRETNNLVLARTMAVHTLVAAETFYLLTISQCLPSLSAWKSGARQPVAYVPFIGIGCVLLLQILFSQIPWINPLFATQPVSGVQALLCMGVGSFVVVPSLTFNRWLSALR